MLGLYQFDHLKKPNDDAFLVQTLTLVENVGGQMRKRACGDCSFVRLVGKYAWEA